MEKSEISRVNYCLPIPRMKVCSSAEFEDVVDIEDAVLEDAVNFAVSLLKQFSLTVIFFVLHKLQSWLSKLT